MRKEQRDFILGKLRTAEEIFREAESLRNNPIKGV